MDEDNNVGRLLTNMENTKFRERANARATKKVKKAIRKTLVLNELEKERKKGIIKGFKSVLAFLNSGEPKLPLLRPDDDLDETLGQKFVRKMIEVPLSILYLPFVAAKMGINAIKLRSWLKQKHELFSNLQTQELFDNIDDFSDDQKQFFHLDNVSEYVDHVLVEHKNYPSEYNDLITGMSEEYQEGLRRQAEEDAEYDRSRGGR